MIVTHQNVSHSLDPTETVSGAPRNWKGIGIAVLVISVILSLVILSISLLTPEDESPDPRPRLTLDDIWAPKFQIHDPEVKWINGDTVIMRTPEGHVIKQSMTTREITLLLENRIFVSLEATKYKVSPNLLYILLASNVTEVYRYSYTATYSICCVQTKSCSELRVPGVGRAPLQFAGWGARGSQLVYIFENNIYYQQSQTSVAQRLTSSGTEGVVYNGIADWLYEEEVLGTSAAHWCSPDGAWLTFAQINDTLVPKMEIPRYLGQLYPRAKIYPYPKMRQPLPSVSLFVVKLYGAAHTLQILPPESLRFSQYYVTMVSWVSNTSLAVRWLNRAQNVSLLTRCEVTTGACVEKHKISSDGWLSKQGEQLLFSPNGSTFFLTVPTQQGAGGRFWHLARFTARAQRTVISKAVRRLQRPGTYTDCTWPRVQLSSGLSHFLLSCYGSGVPTHSVHRVADPRDFFLLSDNQDLREAVKNRQMPLTKLHTLAGKLPLILYVPQGPQVQLRPLLLIMDQDPSGQCLKERIQLDWGSVMASEHGVLVVRVGSQWQRGWRTGSLDGVEQLRTLETLLKTELVDRTRVGVYGKGFGGFLALKVLGLTDGLVQCGVAVSPITDFRLQAATFSERYLGLSARQEDSYMKASVLGEVERLRGKKLLLAHGTADATVHFQHTAELVKQLVDTKANYTLQVYPDTDHFFRTEGNRRHLQKTIVRFFQDCLTSSGKRSKEV